jgi:hypothetical protein
MLDEKVMNENEGRNRQRARTDGRGSYDNVQGLLGGSGWGKTFDNRYASSNASIAVDLPKVGKEFKSADKVKLTFQSFRVSAGTASKVGFFSSLIAFLRAPMDSVSAILTGKT